MVKSYKEQQRYIARVNANWLKRPPKSTKPKARKFCEWNNYQPKEISEFSRQTRSVHNADES